MEELGFEAEAVEALCQDLARMLDCEEAKKLLCDAMDAYAADKYTDFRAMMQQSKDAGALVGVSEYSAYLLLCILLAPILREYYREAGIADAIFVETMTDLRYKLDECKIVKGEYGIFVGSWYRLFFQMLLFAFGRLQFEIRAFRRTYEKGGKRLEPESLVLGVHIPRIPNVAFSPENCEDSYARAAKFFEGRLGDAPTAFVCNSWLLFPEHENFLHEKSNIRKFMSRYEITESKYSEDLSGLWSVFEMDYTGNIEDFPENSFLQKAYKDHLRQGGKAGTGFGVFFAD